MGKRHWSPRPAAWTTWFAIVDRNGFQANVATESLIPLEPFAPKWEAFGWRTSRINGHDFETARPRLRRAAGAARQSRR